MGTIEKKVEQLKNAASPVPFGVVKAVCDRYFGAARSRGSHVIYKMPWNGDPRINIQNRDGYVALYQVKQVLKALARLEEEHG